MRLDSRNPLGMTAVQIRHQGKPFKKIALMLVEMGVFKKRSENHEISIEKRLARLSPVNRKTVASYLEHKRRNRRSAITLNVLAINLCRLEEL